MIAVGLIVATISLLSIVLAELVPRRIAIIRPERIARLFSRPILAFATVAVPLIGLLSRAIDRGLPSLESARGPNRRSRRKKSQFCCEKEPRQGCSRRASTR